jgi:hypothetical protein
LYIQQKQTGIFRTCKVQKNDNLLVPNIHSRCLYLIFLAQKNIKCRIKENM